MATHYVKVWDPLVRVFHWSVAIAFFTAYFSEPEDAGLTLHLWAGYVVGGLVVMRIVWGFVGSPYARFSDFAFGPFIALRYLADLARGRSKRYIGHSPAGAWMILLLLAMLGATVATGLVTLAIERQAGPLAPIFTVDGATSAPTPESGEAESSVEEMHEVFSNIAFGLVVLHLIGVLVASLAHRENLAIAMVTGRKREEEQAPQSGNGSANRP